MSANTRSAVGGRQNRSAVGGGRWAPTTVVAGIIALAACATTPQPATTPAPAPVTVAPTADRRPPTAPIDTIDRSKPPVLAPPPAVSLPPIETRTLANGLRIVVVQQHELPLADFVLLVGNGAEADPANRPGLATFTSTLLTDGTTSRSALQIADQMAYLGVELGSGAGWDASRVMLHTPTAQLDSALALFADVALHPSFPAAELERRRKERLTELLQLKDRAPAIADRAYASIVFGAQHPYGRPAGGTEPATRAITRAEVERFYRGVYRPNNATLIAVGDVTPDDVARRAEALFGKWARGPVTTTRFTAAPKPATTTVYLIDKPGAVQSSIRIGGVGVARNTDDYFALLVMNTILGGSFTSRLNQNLRETHGYTYGAGSRFEMRREPGPFAARAEVTGTKTDSSLFEFMKELRAIRDTVPSAELEKAKRFLELQLPGNFETTGSIAGQVVPIVLYGLPLDYYNGYVQQIERVTQSDVQRVAKRYVDPANAVVVVVGDRKSIEAGVRGLNLGTVIVRDLEGKELAGSK